MIYSKKKEVTMIKPVTMYSVVCDRCGKQFVDEINGIVAWLDERTAKEQALEVTETDKESCKGCFFDSKMFYCEAWRKYPCSIKIRSDHKSVIFKEIKE